MQITSSNVREVRVHQFEADASELGWAPGHWPVQLTTSLGNGQPFQRLIHNGDYVRYMQAMGCIQLVVWND